jgi:hypothetical protein
MNYEKLIKVFIQHAQRNLTNGAKKWMKSCKVVEGGHRNIKSEDFLNLQKQIFVPQLNHHSGLP